MSKPLRLLTLATVVATAVAFTAAVAGAAITTAFDPAAAPTGTHVQRGTPSCSVSVSGTVTCSSYELAGVGNTNAVGNLSATYSATVVCINGGGNPSDSQHQGTFTTTKSTPSLSPKNGRLTVPPLSVTAPTRDQFLAQQTCPNPNWNPTISAITLSSFTDTVSFVGFTGAYITITGP
jgi:hypothetical protein